MQRFYTKLQNQLRLNAAQTIDDQTLTKIKALILEQKQLDDKLVYEESIKDESGDFYNPAFQAAAGSQSATTQFEYEDFMEE